jgi:tetratricopeptide (TPR) repeat protein
MKLWWLLLCGAALSACSTVAPRAGLVDGLFDDALFAPATVAISADAVFAPSPAMREAFDREIRPRLQRGDPRRALIDALYGKGSLRLDYDAEMTRTAAEAFDAHAGNCLSLVIMTATFAREAGLPVRFQSVAAGESWARSGGLLFSIGHVNLGMGRGMASGPKDSDMTEWLTVDFIPSEDLARRRIEVIDEARVLAMYMNNRSAEALALGQVDNAYAWARAAIGQDRTFTGSFNTLGVIYQRRGHLPEAERALRVALAIEPRHLHAMSNLVGVLKAQGRDGEALALSAELQRLQPAEPFAALNEGLQHMREGRYAEAKTLFERELGRTAGYHEVHFWLAVVRLQLGDSRAALRHLRQALEGSTTREQQALYAGKLERLKGLGVY